MEIASQAHSHSGTGDLAKVEPFMLGPMRIDPPARRVGAGDRSEMLEPRVMRVMVALGETPGRVLSRDDLIERCWGGQIVGDKAITRAISMLRHAIEQFGGGAVRIETIAKVGFRIIANSTSPDEGAGLPASASGPMRPGLARRRLMAAGVGGVAALAAGWAVWKGGLLSTAPAEASTVAVLPFRNLSGDKDQDYFSDGLSEQIRSVLSRNPRLRVLAPTSTAAAMEAGDGARNVASKLGAAYLLDGSVRRQGEQLRITARLTDARSGEVAWTDQMDRRFSDVFAVQDDIAGAVAGALAAQTVDAGKPPGKRVGGTSSGKAYDAYLRGEAYAALRTGEASSRAALAQFDAAIAADSGYAEAHAARAREIVYLAASFGKTSDLKAAYDDAVASARRAVALAPRLPIAQATLGNIYVHARLDFRSAAAPFARARELGSGDAKVVYFVAGYYAYIGRQREAAAAAAREIELDPLNPAAYSMAAFAAYCARDYERAMVLCRKTLSLNPRITLEHSMIGNCLIQLGRTREARVAYLAEPIELVRLTGLAIAEWRLGNRLAAQQAYDQLTAGLGDLATYQFAQILAQWGRLDEAMAKLAFARQIGDAGLAMAKTDPLLDPLRARPEFSLFLRRLGFE